MTPSLDASERARLKELVADARSLLEDDLLDQARGRFGIDPDGTIAAEYALRLNPTGLSQRRELVDVVNHLRSEGDEPASAVARLLREATFTHLNRLVAIRIAESIRLVPPSLVNGRSSQGFRDLLELAPSLGRDETGGYWAYLKLCGDELASDVPGLFDPRNPLLGLAPSPGTLDALVDLLADPEAAQLWGAPDCLGWAYQFFNSAEERKAIHDAGAPRDSRELAIANQFFTPRYVVDLLVQNTLGRRLLEADPASALRDDLHLLAETPVDNGKRIDLADVQVLDPAVGSGHFLIAAYDLLEMAWGHAGVPAEQAAPSIIRSLWGIDIDPRCTQVAAAAILLRARRSCPTGELPRPNIVCARALPTDVAMLDDLFEMLPEQQQELVGALSDTLNDAPVLGSLLKIEERMAADVRSAAFRADVDEGTLADAVPPATLDALESGVLQTVNEMAHATGASPGERLLGAEADDAVRFVQALNRRYDAVLMNPPFGAPVKSTKHYLKAAYPWIPSTSDLFALFVGRGLELCNPEGYVGAITPRVGMFLKSFEAWRREILLAHRLPLLADLGQGVMEQAMVEAAAYVLGNQAPGEGDRPVFIRTMTAQDRGAAVSSAIAAVKDGTNSDLVFRPRLERLTELAGSPIAYWVESETVEMLSSHEPFEPGEGVVRQGLATGDDFRYIRAWWEVAYYRLTKPPSLVGGRDERTQLSNGARWAPIVKSGSSQPWFSPALLVVDWERDGERLRSFVDEAGKLRSRPQNTELYFRPGFSWTRRAPRLIPYVVPSGCIPSVSRYQAFPHGDPYAAVGLVASNVASAYCRFYGEEFLRPNFLVENVKTLPIPPVSNVLNEELADCVRSGVAARREIYRHLEPYREFTLPRRELDSLRWEASSLLGEDLEQRVARAYGLSDEQAEQLELDMHEALRFFGPGAGQSTDGEDGGGDIPPWGERLISYLVGVAFGRWDVRIFHAPDAARALPDPFEPPLPSPPGMLVDADQRPATRAPADYPLELPPGGLLVDSFGDEWDIESRMLAAAGFMFEDPEGECHSAVADVGRKALREYIRKQFFRDHLSVYTTGRRRAPIYWPLYVPSGRWGVWVYAPRLTRETLFGIARAAVDRLDQAEGEIQRLQKEREAGGAGRSSREVVNALEGERNLAEELRRFRAEADRIAASGWEPDLDDGTVLCAAPLADLFLSWNEAAGARDAIRAGQYPWSSVSKWAEHL